MSLFAAVIYWIIVALWTLVLAVIGVFCARGSKVYGSTRLLLAVLIVDTTRNLIENVYFGFYFSSQYGLFPTSLAAFLGAPHLIIIPKLINVVAACAVLAVLLLRWLPAAMRERRSVEQSAQAQFDALAQEMEENRRLFETSADLILVADADRVVRRVSHSSLAVLGYTPSEMIGRYGGEFVDPSDFEALRHEIQLSAGGEVIRNVHVDFLHKEGRKVTLALTGVWSEQVGRFFFIARDMTERRAAERALAKLAHYDQLTGLLNRISLRRDLAALKDAAEKEGRVYSVASFDLDGFKAINDALGHLYGDRLLERIARRLEESVVDLGTVYRLGGDQFVVVFPDCAHPLEIGRVIDAGLKRVALDFDMDGTKMNIGASAGVAMTSAGQPVSVDILGDADLALGEAKASGGGAYRIFNPSMRAKTAARQQLDVELRRACFNREFVLYFQPQIRLSDGAIVGAEALLRWRHPQRGLLAPASFIEALARNSAALEVGGWILRTACETAAVWRSQGLPPMRMGINLFPAQFHDPMLLLNVEAALRQTGLPAEALELEITENIALTDDNAMVASLRSLRELGVGLAFDDFGTGYASLSFLTRYPLTRLKIDRSFVNKIEAEGSSNDSAIVRSIILMAHNLGLEVIAEGVETAVQESLLRSKRCNEAQGYYYARPMPADEFQKFLRQSLAPLAAESKRA